MNGPSAAILDVVTIDRLIRVLHHQGRTVIGPVVDGGAIVNAVIDGADQLPWGWTDEQTPGRYRLEPSGSGEAFAFAAPAESWKRHIHPPRALLMTATRDGDELTIERAEPPVDPGNLAFFGVRSCDLAGLHLLDQALHAPPGPGPRRPSTEAASVLDDVFIVAVVCGHPGQTCFCASQGTGPAPGRGYDLALTELHDERGHEFLIEAGTDRGRATLAELGTRSADDGHRARAAAVATRARASMVRTIDPGDLAAAAGRLDHPRWDDVAERCLACANCTMVCPTCFCGSVEDSTDVAGTTASRSRVWDSCFSSSFSELNGIPVRSSTSHRYRQWFLHKLVTWHDQFDASGCVGCGRCITWCPAGIDLIEEASALGRDPIAESGHASPNRNQDEDRNENGVST